MNEFLMITYAHRCTCSRAGEKVEVHEQAVDGVAYGVIAPVCIESGAQLEEIDRKTR